MARFYIGQRVRIKWSYYWPELNGTLGTIASGELDDCNDGRRAWVGYEVAADLWGSVRSPNGGIFAPAAEQLEPATDSYDKTEWKDCLWQPEHLRETA